MSKVFMAFGIVLVLAAADDRTAWQVADKKSKHDFRTPGGGVWYETDKGKINFTFRETSRTPEAVTIIDAPRNIAVRLSNTQSELSVDGGKKWTPFENGHWVELKSLPAVPLPSPRERRRSRGPRQSRWRRASVSPWPNATARHRFRPVNPRSRRIIVTGALLLLLVLVLVGTVLSRGAIGSAP